MLTNTPGRDTEGETRADVDDLGGFPDELGSSFDCAAERYAAKVPSTSVTSLPQSDFPVEIITYIIGNETYGYGYSGWGHGLPVCCTACTTQAYHSYSRRQSGEDTPDGQRRKDQCIPCMGRQRLEWQPL